MIDKEITQAAHHFLTISWHAEEFECGYFYEDDTKSKENYFNYLNLTKSRNHEFQTWLDKQAFYKSALIKLESKDIFWPLHVDEENSEKFRKEDLISVRTHFDAFIAFSIFKYSEINRVGAEYFLEPNHIDIQKVINKAKELQLAIKSASTKVQHLIADIGFLDRNLSILTDEKADWAQPQFYGFDDHFITLGKRHAKSEREILIRYMSDRYVRRFGRWKEFPVTSPSLCDEPSVLQRATFDYKLNNNTEDKKNYYWSDQDQDGNRIQTVHADILLELITFITNDYDLSERKIYDIAQKQKLTHNKKLEDLLKRRKAKDDGKR